MRFARRAVPAVLTLAVLAGGCGGSKDSTKARAARTTPVAHVALPGGRIAFRRYLDDARTRGALFTINPDGSGEQQLTDPPAGRTDDHPAWSPDGKRIAYQRCDKVEHRCQVFTVDAGGGTPRAVTAHCTLAPVCDLRAPAWTPDGRLLVALRQGRERMDSVSGEGWIQQSSLELLDLDTHRQRSIVTRRGFTGYTDTPAVSPDGRTVVYARRNSIRSTPAFGDTLFVVGIDGSGNRRLTPWRLGGGDHPAFAPDGTILFRSYEGQDSRQSDYWTVRPDGTDLRRLTHYHDGTVVLSTSYSPDGRWIAHATNGVDGNADVFVMRADGTGDQPVTKTHQWDSAPDWGPA
jgi:TolB protein